MSNPNKLDHAKGCDCAFCQPNTEKNQKAWAEYAKESQYGPCEECATLTTALAAEKEKVAGLEEDIKWVEEERDIITHVLNGSSTLEHFDVYRSHDALMARGMRDKNEELEAKVAEQAAEILDREAQHKDTSEMAGAALNKVARLVEALTRIIDNDSWPWVETERVKCVKQAIADSEGN